MKRGISLALALIMLFGLTAFTASAEDEPLVKVYYVTLPEENKMFKAAPVDGYSQYVAEGEVFEFYVQAKESYSIKAAIVSVDDTVLFKTDDIDEYFPGHSDIQVYRITVNSDVTVTVRNILAEDKASLFEWLIKLVNNIVAFFQRIFGVTTP